MGGWMEPDRELRLSRGSQSLDKILVSYSPRAAITKYHKLCDLHNRNSFSHTSGRWKAEMEVLAGSVSSEVSPFGLQMAAFSLCPYMVLPLYISVLISFFLFWYH